MYGLTRATTTLLFAAVAGFLIWIASQISNDHVGGYWARVGLVAGAGLVMALSQLLGGWTKWGWPRFSPHVLLVAFVPVAVASLWVILAGEPGSGWFHSHVISWSGDIHISGLVTDLLYYIPVLAFGTGLVFGYSFDTTWSGRTRSGRCGGTAGTAATRTVRASAHRGARRHRHACSGRAADGGARDGRDLAGRHG